MSLTWTRTVRSFMYNSFARCRHCSSAGIFALVDKKRRARTKVRTLNVLAIVCLLCGVDAALGDLVQTFQILFSPCDGHVPSNKRLAG